MDFAVGEEVRFGRREDALTEDAWSVTVGQRLGQLLYDLVDGARLLAARRALREVRGHARAVDRRESAERVQLQLVGDVDHRDSPR